ncbi:CBS domain-containing protein [Tessaracoccus sp. OS52]|uniref:CBS domain-containing protein n=1 Tax=Tessaracoccus sp. OS52 TaxID=2886691 RepID=UPI001D115E1F|nr:CBS domain-containing protein [Tessaracoccus sp. OS52]MCC2592667.1 CBS domain-containing protein [Tessaracoccus sp. OS52]
MRISEVIHRKGSHVVTIAPDATVADLLKSLYDNRIGAVVVSNDQGQTVAGIVSERDVVIAIHERGMKVLEEPVSAIMTGDVQTCGLDDDLKTLAIQMTEHRVRHLPVIEDDRLVAIVSIGDVVKHRLDELEDETSQLFHYVQGDRSTV